MILKSASLFNSRENVSPFVFIIIKFTGVRMCVYACMPMSELHTCRFVSTNQFKCTIQAVKICLNSNFHWLSRLNKSTWYTTKNSTVKIMFVFFLIDNQVLIYLLWYLLLYVNFLDDFLSKQTRVRYCFSYDCDFIFHMAILILILQCWLCCTQRIKSNFISVPLLIDYLDHKYIVVWSSLLS